LKLHYMGKYSMNPDDLPHDDHEPGTVAFKEPKDSKTLGRVANAISIGLVVITLAIIVLYGGHGSTSWVGVLLAIVTFVPHELLHAICFRDDVYMYTNLRHGMLFVAGTERMSKKRFILMSMLPNIVFGFIPFIIFLINPTLGVLGTMGAICISAGAGDYINVFNAVTQMPKGAYTYMHKFNSFWYLPYKELS